MWMMVHLSPKMQWVHPVFEATCHMTLLVDVDNAKCVHVDGEGQMIIDLWPMVE